MSIFSGILDRTARIAARSQKIAGYCRQVVQYHNAENNFDFATNGEANLLREYLPGATEIFDVGANVGDWIELALKVNSRLRIHAFEPSHETFQSLAKRGFPSNVVLNNMGCGAKVAEAELYIDNKSSGLNSLIKRDLIESSKSESISLTTVDVYCQTRSITNVDLIKIDVEGYEFEVIKGMASALAEGRVKAIQFEYGATFIDAGVFLKDIWQFVSALNKRYQFFKLHPHGLTHYPCYDQTLENFAYANYLIKLPDGG